MTGMPDDLLGCGFHVRQRLADIRRRDIAPRRGPPPGDGPTTAVAISDIAIEIVTDRTTRPIVRARSSLTSQARTCAAPTGQVTFLEQGHLNTSVLVARSVHGPGDPAKCRIARR